MTFQTGVTEFAEFVGSEIKRIEKKIPTDGGGSQSSDSMVTGDRINLIQQTARSQVMSQTELSIIL